jgi:diguanylate cyclase (GGDEF)-like protein
MTRYHPAMPSRILRLLRCCALLVPCGMASAAQWQAFDVDDGLPQNSAVAMTVDRFGLLWVGTEDGLARFDGQRFVAFDDAVDRGWLTGNYIVALASDDEAVWIAAESGGLARFDLDRERFDVVPLRDPDGGRPLNIWSLTVDGDRLWVGTRDRGLFALDRNHPEQVVDHWHEGAKKPERRLRLRAVRDAAVDARGRGLWIAGVGGLFHIDAEHGAVQSATLDGIDPQRADPDVASVFGRADGSLWLGLRSHGVARRREGAREFAIVPFAAIDGAETPVVNRLIETAKGHIVAATDRGLHLYDADCDCFRATASASPLRRALDDALVLSVVDDGDVIWAGSWNRGLFRFDPQAPDFDLLAPTDLGGREAPVAPRSLYVDREQRLWVGSFGAGARYATIEDRPMAQWSWQRWLGQVGSRDRQVWAFAESRDGDLFIGSDVGVTRWRDQGRDVAHLDLEPEQMDELRCLTAASDGAIWASTVGGVHRIDPRTLATRRFARDDGLNDLRVYALAEWPRGRLTIGTWSGLYTLALDGTRIHAMPLRIPGQPQGSGLVWDLHTDAEGGLWIGTSNGLLHLDRNGTTRRFAENDGLPNDVVYAIEARGDHELWLSTNRGLARFDRRSGRAIAFDAEDGLQGNEFGFGMAAQDARGRMYFAGLGGVSRFDPARMQIAPRAPRPMLTRFYLRDREIAVGSVVNDVVPLPQSLFATDRIALGWRDHDLGFAFSALAGDPTARLRFRYRLGGKDDDWIDAGERRYVSYTNLAPGQYAFAVKAADRFGREGPVRRIHIDLAPPVWATWPFRIGAALAAMMLLVAVLNWRVATLKRSREQLAAEVARQTERIRVQNEQLEAANQALFDRSIRDPLTGAFNRRHFGELAEQAYLGCRARAQPFALMLLDLDHFKQINDRHGHAAGDAVLCAVAQAIRPLLAGQEAMARWGGEEFVVMWPNHDVAAAMRRALALRDVLRALRIVGNDTPLRVTASFGLACATTTHQPGLEALLAEADAALYRAKAEGRDRVVAAPGPGA